MQAISLPGDPLMQTLQALQEALDPRLFWEYRSILLKGLLYNVLIFALAALGATVIGFFVGTARLSSSRPARMFASAYTEFFRNVPEYPSGLDLLRHASDRQQGVRDEDCF